MAALYPVWERLDGGLVNSISRFSGMAGLVCAPLSFIVYPGYVYKNLFLLCAAANITTVGSDFGNVAELATGLGRPVNLLVHLAVFAVIKCGRLCYHRLGISQSVCPIVANVVPLLLLSQGVWGFFGPALPLFQLQGSPLYFC